MNQENTITSTSAEQLVAAGFSPEQLAKLEQLRACYPLIELVDQAEWEQLRFLRWRHREGQCPAG